MRSGVIFLGCDWPASSHVSALEPITVCKGMQLSHWLGLDHLTASVPPTPPRPNHHKEVVVAGSHSHVDPRLGEEAPFPETRGQDAVDRRKSILERQNNGCP